MCSSRPPPRSASSPSLASSTASQRSPIKAFILSDEFSGTSTYVDNLKVAAAAEYVEARQIGLLASAPRAYTRHLETAAERQAKQARWEAEKAAKKVSDYLGSEGDKLKVEVTVNSVRHIAGDYGTTHLFTMTTAEGNIVKWFASNEVLEEGQTVTLQGTVKKHDDYNGTKSTVLTRCKEINPVTGKPFNTTYKVEGMHAYGEHQETPHKDCKLCYLVATGQDAA